MWTRLIWSREPRTWRTKGPSLWAWPQMQREISNVCSRTVEKYFKRACSVTLTLTLTLWDNLNGICVYDFFLECAVFCFFLYRVALFVAILLKLMWNIIFFLFCFPLQWQPLTLLTRRSAWKMQTRKNNHWKRTFRKPKTNWVAYREVT